MSFALVYLMGANGLDEIFARESAKISSSQSNVASSTNVGGVTIDSSDLSMITLELGVVPSLKSTRFLFTPLQLGLSPESLDSTTFQTSCDCIDVRVVQCRQATGTTRKIVEVIHKAASKPIADSSNLLLVLCRAISRGQEPRQFCLSLEVVSSPDL